MRLLVVLALVPACVQSATVICGGRVCPADSHCDEANGLCIPPKCGDGVLDPGEDCDGTLAQDCTDYGYYSKDGLACSPICKIDTTGCGATCGDHVINGPELCDGIPPAGRTCADVGFDVGRLACSSACEPGVEACAYIGWRSAPGGGTDELRAVSGPFAVGLDGLILHGVGDVWTPIASSTTSNLNGVWTGTSGAFAVGEAGTILHFDGTSWTAMTSPTTSSLLAVDGYGDQVYAVGAAGTILHYDGATWTSMTSSPTMAGVFRSVSIGATTGFAVGDGGNVYQLVSGTWTKITNPPTAAQLNAVFAVAGHVFVAGNVGVFAHYDTTTGTWSPLFPLPVATVPLFSLWGSSFSNIFVGGQGGVMLHFNGFELVEQGSNTSRSIFGLWGNAPTHVWGATRGGSVIEFNGTDRVAKTALPSLDNIYAVYSASGGAAAIAAGGSAQIIEYGTQLQLDVWNPPTTVGPPATATTSFTAVWRQAALVIVGAEDLVGAGSGLYYSTTGVGPSAFTKVGLVPNAILGIYGVTGAAQRIVAVGAHVYTSSDGTNWTQPSAPNGTSPIYAVWATPNGSDWFAVGGTGLVMHGNSMGTGWTVIPTNITERLLAVWGTSAQDFYVAGRIGTLLHYDGTKWQRIYTGTAENLTSITGTSHDDVFVGGSNGMILHYDGVAWSRMSPVSFGDVLGTFTSNKRTFFVGQTGGAELLSRMCVATEDRCDNAWDDDCDGLTNCDDDDCAGNFACVRGGACPTLDHLDCGQVTSSTYTGIARIDDFPCLTHSTPGPEHSFKFAAKQSGSVTVTLTGDDALDLVVTDEQNATATQDGACAIATCRAAAGSGGTKLVTFDATAGSTYYLVVDGPLYTAKDFTLAVSVACP